MANKILPGLGYFVALLVALGGLAFNVGNIGGTALGFNVVFNVDLSLGAVLSALFILYIFHVKETGKAMDTLTKVLGGLMLLLTLYVAVVTNPPAGKALTRAVAPRQIALLPIITLMGGTVGGYITFAGGHRLVEGGLTGRDYLRRVTNSAVQSVAIASLVRVFLFLAVYGVVATGFSLDSTNPAASAFQAGAGQLGYKIFGVVLWSAGLTSVLGASYTSVSFLRSLHPSIAKHQTWWISGFIVASTLLFVSVQRPVTLLILVGSLNGLILPLVLGPMLVAAYRKEIIGDYQHPTWLLIFGILVVAIALYAGVSSLKGISALWH